MSLRMRVTFCPRPLTGKVLREVEVVASSGARTAVGDLMTGRGAVVVFLRHLG